MGRPLVCPKAGSSEAEEEQTTKTSGKQVTVEDLSENEIKLIRLIAKMPQVTAKQAAAQLAITPRQCQRLFAELKQKGILKRDGGNRHGQWVVVSTKR